MATTIFQMSFSASILIVSIVIIRAIALHKVPKKTFLVLWGIAALRLLVPFSIPSAFSVYTGAALIKSLLVKKTGALSPDGVVNLTENVAPMPGVGQIMGSGVSTASFSAIQLIWLAGMGVCALFFLAAYVKCRREFKMSLPVENHAAAYWLQEHPLRRPVQIRQSDRIKAALTYGALFPVILLPKKMDWTDEKRLSYVLTHEHVHIQRFDTLTKLVLTACVCVHWFNPLVWVMYVLANRDIELSCDEAVVRIFGESMKTAYALTLIGLEETKGRLSPLVNHFCKNATEEWIVSIMKIKKTSLAGIILATAMVAGITTAFATSAANGEAQDNSSLEELDRQMNEEADTQTAANTMMSYIDGIDGKTYYSWDEGKTWTPLTDEEYEAMYPAQNIEWWTYDEYKAWLDNEKIQLKEIIGEKGWNPTRGWYVWTQKDVDETVKLYEEILQEIKGGMKVSKSVNGDENVVMSYNPNDIEIGTSAHEYSLIISLDNVEEAYFGPYSTKPEILAAVKPYCEEQVKDGNMSQQEADEILSRYN